MFSFKVYKNVYKTRGLKCKCLCSTYKQATLVKTVNEPQRKYLKKLAARELRPWRGSNLHNFFTGTINKNIFEYPTAPLDEDFDTVLSQSSNVESFFALNQNCKLTNDVIEKLKELELFGLSVPQNFGGAGYSETETKFLLECSGCNPTVARFLGYNEDFGCRIINHYGTEEQKQKYLPDLVKGNIFITPAYLEKGPLIDLSKIEGSVISDSENKRFTLNAEKKWVHNADKADLFLVMLKRAILIEENHELQVRFDMYLVDKNLPGVAVHELKSQKAKEANLYEVSFKDVSVPSENLLGSSDTDGFEILKFGLSHSNLTDATLCLCLMKRLLHDGIQFAVERNLENIKIRGHLHVKENITLLMGYIYALESVVYLLTGNLDTYDKPDLFNDAILAKVLAVDFLRIAIQLYSEIVGHESLKKSGIIDEAIEALHYHSALEDNIEYFKLMCAADGLIAASTKLAKKVKMFKNPFDNPYESLKVRYLVKSELKKFKSQLNLKMELHSTFSSSADMLEENLMKLNCVIQKLFLEKGSLAIYCEHSVAKLADIASYLLAAVACLSRASSSVCYDVKNFENETLIAKAFMKMIDIKIENLSEEEIQQSELVEFYRQIGKSAFNFKEYPMEHPLARAF